MQYPTQHKRIVQELTAGRFIADNHPLFEVINEHRSFYAKFFEATYDYVLEVKEGFFFLSSKQTEERASTDMLLMLAVLAYEYQNVGQDLVQKIHQEAFLVQDIKDTLESSSQYDLIQQSQVRELEKWLDFWARRHFILFEDKQKQRFRFQKPIRLFLEAAVNLQKEHIQES